MLVSGPDGRQEVLTSRDRAATRAAARRAGWAPSGRGLWLASTRDPDDACPSPHRRPARRRRASAGGLLLSRLLVLGARTPRLEPYAPSDGLQAELGDLLVRNMLVVSEGDGAPGLLVGALVNRGDDDATVHRRGGRHAGRARRPGGGRERGPSRRRRRPARRRAVDPIVRRRPSRSTRSERGRAARSPSTVTVRVGGSAVLRVPVRAAPRRLTADLATLTAGPQVSNL